MLSYLSKFVLQMLPTISATVIGADIVSTWIDPKTPAQPAKIAAQQATAKAPAVEPPAQDPVQAAVEAKAEIKSPEAESAKPAKVAKGPDSIRIIPIVKQAAAVTDAPVGAPETVSAIVDERKDANELARAAIQRLRGGSDTVRATEETAKLPAVRVQQARVAPDAPQALPTATAASAPPLPPAVTISAPRYPQADVADQSQLTQAERLSPPGEIPTTRPPISLHASHRVAENPSLADDFVSATKSFFRAITPQ